MGDEDVERRALADHIRSRRTAILDEWSNAIRRDPQLSTGDSLPKRQLFDHIPGMLTTFENGLRRDGGAIDASIDAAQEPAAAHGLQRWQQGYDLREVIRELGKLNECVVAELDAYAAARPHAPRASMTDARRMWAALASTGIEESVSQFFELQQQEASGQVKDLEAALEEIHILERQRADLWRQAAHDLRGNLGVVANATVGLAHGGLREGAADDFVRILMRSVAMLHHLLDDVTSLARLQAGREQRQVEALDVSQVLYRLCEGIRPLAQQRHLFLRCDGPPGFGVDGDAVKIQRIAQNLILNAVKFTREGGITVSWGDSRPEDPKRWLLCIADTGPGLPTDSAAPMVNALEHRATPVGDRERAQLSAQSGEGIGLSIVKRLCELLDATLEVQSTAGVGTSFRILFPRRYGG